MADKATDTEAFDKAPDLPTYMQVLVHQWSKTLAMLGFTLIPIFFILDVFMMPSDLLPRFGVNRGITTLLIVVQYLVIKHTRPSKWSYLHGHFFTLVAGGMIAIMTVDLGGFNSTYYAGLNLVLSAANMLLPWAYWHSALNSVIIVVEYLGFNLIWGQPYDTNILVNNLYFLMGTAVISTSINFVKQRLIQQEFFLRTDLKGARDALWGEMEIAKHIQTALLPRSHRLDEYEVGAVMKPADEVGGDYYDVLVTRSGEKWLSIGDVSGHGVESGLIMMMTQTSLLTTVNEQPGLPPSAVLARVNAVLRQNIMRMGAERYVTATAVRVDGNTLVFSGRHQDILVYRHATGLVETVETDGSWLGLVDDVTPYMRDDRLTLSRNDVVLMFTDGVTEAQDGKVAMYGQDRLKNLFQTLAARTPVDQLVHAIEKDVADFSPQRYDDVTLLALKRLV